MNLVSSEIMNQSNLEIRKKSQVNQKRKWNWTQFKLHYEHYKEMMNELHKIYLQQYIKTTSLALLIELKNLILWLWTIQKRQLWFRTLKYKMENRVLNQEKSLNSRYFQIEIKSDMTKAKCIIQCLIEIQVVKAEE